MIESVLRVRLAAGDFKLISAFFRGLILASIGLLVIACTPQEQKSIILDMPDGKTSFSPVEQSKDLTLFTQGNAMLIKHNVSIKQIDTPLDIVLLYDRTASMKDVIDETGEAGNQIVNEIQKIIPDTRFAIASIADYKVFSPDLAENDVWQLLSDFEQSPKVLQQAIKSIETGNGGDTPEAYTRGFYEVSKLNWRPQAKKLVIFFGDSTPHSPDPGEDGILHTKDDLDWQSTIQLVKSKGIQVVGIHTNEHPEVINTFKHITQQTKGKMFLLDDAKQVSRIIKKSIYSTFMPEFDFQAVGSNKEWVQNILQKEALFADDIQYQVQLKVPENTPAGVYPIQLHFTPGTLRALAKYNINSDKEFTIYVVTGWYNNFWLPLLPLIVLLVVLFYFFIRARQGCSVTSRTIYSLDGRYSLSKLLIDLLFILALLGMLLWAYLYTQDVYISQLINQFLWK